MDNSSPKSDPFKKFWIVTINNWITDASYSGKELKSKHIFPSFREFHFIKKIDELKRFNLRESISNEELCEKLLFVETSK